MNESQTINNNAEIIILLAHYNDNERLKNAIQSIEEPFPVDVLIVDDGSDLRPQLSEYRMLYGNKGKIDIKYASKNMGASKVRNWGLEMISETDYQFIGIMDSDDTNKPHRFAKQLSYLKKNKHIALLGAWGDYYDTNGKFLFTLKHPTSYSQIKKKMYLNSTFLHSSVLYRREVAEVIGEYSDQYKKGGEDYDYMFRVMSKYHVENYPETLVNITVTKHGLSSQQRFSQVLNRIRIIGNNFYFGFYPIFGIIRNIILLVAPRNLGLKIRKLFNIEKLPI